MSPHCKYGTLYMISFKIHHLEQQQRVAFCLFGFQSGFDWCWLSGKTTHALLAREIRFCANSFTCWAWQINSFWKPLPSLWNNSISASTKYCLVQNWSMALEPISLLHSKFALQSHLQACRQDSLQLKLKSFRIQYAPSANGTSWVKLNHPKRLWI